MSTHPVPSVVVAGLTAAFSWSAGLAPTTVIVVGLAMLANQTGIGLGNDWLDYRGDAVSGRRDKPVARGDVTPTAVRNASFVLGAAALLLSSLLGPWALLCQAVMLASGWWYNLHAKRHITSVASYLLGFGLLPIFALLADSPPRFPDAWVVAVAALLGASAHFANALPDLLDDRLNDIRGMPQILGPRWSGVIVLILTISATVTIAVMGTSLPLWFRGASAFLALTGALGAAVLAFRSKPPRIIFPLIIAVSVVCVGGICLHLASS